MCGLSIKRCGFALDFLKTIVELSLSYFGPLDAGAEAIISDIHGDVRTVIDAMDVTPVTRSYVCCPKCFACYPLDGTNSYPDRCSYRATPASDPCDCKLRVTRRINGKDRTFPARRYIYHDFKHWLGRLLCRPGIEEAMDRHIRLAEDVPEFIGDFADASVLRDFVGPDGELFVQPNSGEGRYVFSLCMDGLNPNGRGGSSVSVGAIYLACLNLPLDIRYKEENMYLAAIIPGPHEPSLDQINPLLTPLIDDFVDLWHHGVRYSQTPRHPCGKTVRCAIIPLVSDLPAARQMSGFAPHQSHHLCSFCETTLADIEDTEWWKWKGRNCEEHRLLAERWKNASTEAERDQIYQDTGVRWSELLRLPYWDPTRFVALDPMHALFLGIFKRHCTEIWGMDPNLEDGLLGIAFDPSSRPPTDDEMRSAYEIFRTGSSAQLSGLSVHVLRQICKEQNVRFSGHKNQLVERLLQQVSAMHSSLLIFDGDRDSAAYQRRVFHRGRPPCSFGG